jgi:hypothetical protein
VRLTGPPPSGKGEVLMKNKKGTEYFKIFFKSQIPAEKMKKSTAS